MRKVLMTLWVGLYGLTGHAQQLPDAVDLKAAYCTAIVQNQLAVFEEGLPSLTADPTTKPQTLATITQQMDDTKARLERLRRYLVPRIPFLDPAGLVLARQQGLDDQARSLKLLSSCMNTCQARACLDACVPSELVAKLRACNTTDWLPF